MFTKPSRRSLKRHQSGLSIWGWLVFVALIALAGSVALRIGPHYFDFRMVQGVLERLPESDVHDDMSRADITKFFKKQFRVENFKIPVKDLLRVERDLRSTTIHVEYEIREHLFFNIDAVLTFSEQRSFY